MVPIDNPIAVNNFETNTTNNLTMWLELEQKF